MKLALIGYGKMGKEIAEMATSLGHEIACIFDVENIDSLKNLKPSAVDVAIEFTRPDTAPVNIKTCIDAGIPVVCGSTGWHHQLDEIETYCQEKKGCLFYASNFSIGMNIFFEINKKLAKLMEVSDGYNARIEETHHIHKLDQPSGTAVVLANQLVGNNKHFVKWVLNNSQDISDLPVYSFRKGEVTGDHKIMWESNCDTIEISHSAKNRKGFAIGAIRAAAFIAGKTGIYQMKDLLNI
ncbi:MAG TPA: 4-hydroxy-tetrahydrodipicolinate reductase [Bacteroidales bacterium]|nr:4-hydroxy-tetrahydrodipicolinate reductase [Bacteroidales bacterium]HOE04317.1 4-hydroxy-tetrahydrodipicolinate reductase [Bacteroidales bacterium]HQL69568.1 4-hydroxy-tetrahydrodipicolinate reductase [Bacteroidales bacterium]